MSLLQATAKKDVKFYSKINMPNVRSGALELDYRIISCKSGMICAEGHSSHCFTDTNLKPVRTKHKYPDVYRVFADYNGYEITD